MDHSGEENKKELIIEYAFKKGKEHELKEEIIKKIIIEVIESQKTIGEIIEDINKLIAKYKEEANKEGEDLSEEMRPKESTSIYSTSPSGSMVITPQSEQKESSSIYSTSPSGSMIITPQSEQKESSSIYSTSPSGSMVITPKPKDDSRNELQRMMESDERKEKESTPMHKESPSRVMVKTNNNTNKGYASTMSIASSLGIIIGIIFLLLLLLLLI
ncbi:MAG: hypothetical protein IJJ63_02535 [Bacilli bacterium]|nr:hypothetical protein [Bacilli bacterium]